MAQLKQGLVKPKVVVESERRQLALKKCQLIGLIEKLKRLGDAVEMSVFAHNLEAERMKSSGPKFRSGARRVAGDTLPYLTSRLVGECQRKDGWSRDTLPE